MADLRVGSPSREQSTHMQDFDFQCRLLRLREEKDGRNQGVTLQEPGSSKEKVLVLCFGFGPQRPRGQ